MTNKSWIWNYDDCTLRGSGIQIIITGIYLILILLGVCIPTIAHGLKEISTLLISWYTVTFGLWITGKTISSISSISLNKISSLNPFSQSTGTETKDNSGAGTEVKTGRIEDIK